MYSSIVLPHRVKSMIVPGTMKNCETFNLIQLCKKKSYNNSIVLLYSLLYILYLYYLYNILLYYYNIYYYYNYYYLYYIFILL